MISQIAIVLFSGISIWALAGKRYRLGFIAGLCGQPFWIYAVATQGQWGMLIVSLWFTVNHARGLWEHRPLLSTGTKSLLFGVHQFIWHPITVLIAWKKIYQSWPTWRELICIIIHDWGYWGQEHMDDVEGEKHPELAAHIAMHLFEDQWYSWFCLYHSRHYARYFGMEPSPLCWADKLSIIYDPWWLYLPRAWMSGELFEYREAAASAGLCPITATHREWYAWIREKFLTLAKEKRADAVPYARETLEQEAK